MDWLFATVVCPMISYGIVIGVLWLTSASIFFATSALPCTGFPATIVRALMLIVPLILAILAARKWLKFCVDRYGITKQGIAVHIAVVSLAVIATLVWLVTILPCG